MIFIFNPYSNPYFNLAAEEFLLNQITTGFIMLWQNDNTVVVGKHQNALAEINFKHVYENNIKVVRRISGGGTVFHDKGNLNFSIALPIENENKIVNFIRFISPVISYLNSLGIKAEPSGRNDIIVGDLKISGNAEHHFRKEKLILHHGTLLFDSDIENLGNAIKAIPNRYSDMSVQSIRSKVTNIRKLMQFDMDINKFSEGLAQHLIQHFGVRETRGFSCDETDQIEALAVTKYETDEWNYGYSPSYTFRNSFEFNESMGNIFLEVARDSLITKVKIEHPDRNLFDNLERIMLGKKHFPSKIDSIIKHFTHNNTSHLSPLTFSFF
ncbi:MAG: lipoate--protein ligase family protein [Bacteroidetes bacterium]|nr:lipoate--protein ligase family protein [Bacteroidota bacterium]